MKKTIVMVVLGSVLWTGALLAEPLTLEQASNVLPVKTLEIGLADIAYQRDVTNIVDNGGTEVLKLTTTEIFVPVFGKYAFTDHLEGTVHIPYASLNSKSETDGISTTSSDSGMADSVIAAKMNFLNNTWQFGAAAELCLPTGAKIFREGLDVTPLVALRRDFGKFIVNGNLSYDITGAYDDNSTTLKLNPGDILSAGLGAEVPCKKVQGMECLGEFIFQNISTSKVEGVTQSGSSGNRMDLSLGVRYKLGDWKTKLGLDLPLGKEKFRTYDYKIVLGITYLIKL